jgi:hypothetical protein
VTGWGGGWVRDCMSAPPCVLPHGSQYSNHFLQQGYLSMIQLLRVNARKFKPGNASS